VLLISYDLMFFNEPCLTKRLWAALGPRVSYLPQGCELLRPMTEAGHDPCVIITSIMCPSRVRLLERLIGKGIPLRLHGGRFSRWADETTARAAHTDCYATHKKKALTFWSAVRVLNTMHASEMSGVNSRLVEAAGYDLAVVTEFRRGRVAGARWHPRGPGLERRQPVRQAYPGGSIAADQSPFAEITAVPPDNVAVASQDRQVKARPVRPDGPAAVRLWPSDLGQAMPNSVELYLGVGPPTALLLSEGVDSATVAAIGMGPWLAGPLTPLVAPTRVSSAPVWSVVDRGMLIRTWLRSPHPRARWAKTWALTASNAWLETLAENQE
jgi:hypothetical protein